QLDKQNFGGGPGDLFPASSDKRNFDSTTNPSSMGQTAVCNIRDSGPSMEVTISMGRSTCAGNSPGMGQMAPSGTGSQFSRQSARKLQSLDRIEDVEEGSTITIQGILKNVGTNLFDRKSRRIVVEDKNGQQVDARLSLPLEIFPPQAGQGSSEEKPAQISSVLGKEAEITGRVHHKRLDEKTVPVIEIESVHEITK